MNEQRIQKYVEINNSAASGRSMKQPLFSTSYAPRDGESTLDEIEQLLIFRDEGSVLEVKRKLLDQGLLDLGFLAVGGSIVKQLRTEGNELSSRVADECAAAVCRGDFGIR